MKRSLFIALAFFAIQLASAQDTAQAPAEDNKIYDNYEAFDVRPDYPGGIGQFYYYMMRNFKVPDVDGSYSIEISFVIEKDGTLTDIQVKEPARYEFKKEALRLMKNCTKWNPGVLNGKAVRCTYTVPIKINNN